jgi:hypothetical protein
MESGSDRYANFIATAGARTFDEPRLIDVEPDYPEIELQAHWFSGSFGRVFTATDGRRVEIVQFGTWNHESGPDFVGSAVSLDGGEPLGGAVELDSDVRDWERHGHALNPNYENVILHLFTRSGGPEFFTRTISHKIVPQVQLNLAVLLDAVPPEWVCAHPGRCLAPLAAFGERRTEEILTAAAQYRVRKKGAALVRLAEVHGPSEALYQAFATALGYKANKVPFTILSQRLPLRLLRSDATAAEALLFGTAGFLEQPDFDALAGESRAYVRRLWETWWQHRATLSAAQVPRDLWRMGGQRPMNHPQRRLGALAAVVGAWSRLQKLVPELESHAIRAFFETLEHPFWQAHYTLGSRPAARRMRLLGRDRVDDIIANITLPLAILRDPSRWDEYLRLPLREPNAVVETAAARLLGGAALAKKWIRKPAFQQGLTQIFQDFCQRDRSDCVRCPFPEQIAHW